MIPDYIERLIEEAEGLQRKVMRLAATIEHGVVFPTLPKKHQTLMKEQLGHMRDYLEALHQRLFLVSEVTE